MGSTDGPGFKPYSQPGPYQGAGAGYGPGQHPPREYTPSSINHSTQPYSTAAPTGGRKKGQVGGTWDEVPAPALNSRSAAGAGAPYGGADPYGPYGSAGAGASAAGSYAAHAHAQEHAPARTHTGGGEFEKKVVSEIVLPSGVRALPTAAELAAFVKRCQSLDAYDITALLDAKLAPDVPPASQLVRDVLLPSVSA